MPPKKTNQKLLKNIKKEIKTYDIVGVVRDNSEGNTTLITIGRNGSEYWDSGPSDEMDEKYKIFLQLLKSPPEWLKGAKVGDDFPELYTKYIKKKESKKHKKNSKSKKDTKRHKKTQKNKLKNQN